MKNFLTLVLVFVIGTAQAQTKETIVINTQISCDHCLDCESCGPRVSKAIRKTSGIGKVRINPKKNTITVTYDPAKTNPDKIRTAISNVGFDADDVKASPEAYNNLDACCKKD